MNLSNSKSYDDHSLNLVLQLELALLVWRLYRDTCVIPACARERSAPRSQDESECAEGSSCNACDQQARTDGSLGLLDRGRVIWPIC